MALTLPECKAIVEELTPALSGGFIQKIHQPRPLSMTMDIRTPGRTCSFLVCVEPRYARLHLTLQKFENPATPPPFCAFLRSCLEGGKIVKLNQEPGDRIIYLTIVKAGQEYVVVVALTGNQSNIHVLDRDGSVVRSLRKSRMQEGERYVPPSTQSSKTQFAHPSPDPFGDTAKDAAVGQPETGTGKPSSKVPPQKKVVSVVRYPVSTELETRYGKQEQDESNDAALRQQLAQVRKDLKHANRKVQALQEDCKKTERFREYSRYGELLKSHLHEIKKGQKTITLVDYFDPALPSLTLPLDPSKDAAWNLNDYFRKYHKFTGAQEHLQPRVDRAQEEVWQLEAKLKQLEQGRGDPDFLPKPKKTSALSNTAVTRGASKSKPASSQGYRTYTSADGVVILVGKTAKDNDYLTFKVATPHDLWLHARGTPGSHVVVRLDKGAAVPPETLKDAATLTLWFSDLRKSGKGEVIYTFRKFVKKGKGFKSGAVMVEREKSIWIELKDDRLERLKHGLT